MSLRSIRLAGRNALLWRVLLSLLVIGSPGICNSAAVAKPAHWCGARFHTSSPATIFGTLRKRSDFGPPNFGEHPQTDQKVTVWIVHLDFAIPVEVNRELKMTPKVVLADEIQISFSGKVEPLLPRYRNRHVRVSGTLWTQVNWQDFTPVVIAPDTIRIAGKSDCRGEEAAGVRE